MAARRETTPTPPLRPSPASLAALVALGVTSALWALYQWTELVHVRAGGEAFCAVSDTVNCANVWSAPAASAIHRLTGLPVAAWGLVWSLTALTLPLWALTRRAADRPLPPLVAAVRVNAGVGVLASVGLAAVAWSAGALCLGCLGTYVLVGLYAGVAFIGWRSLPLTGLLAGLGRAGALTIVFALLLLWPGLSTPTGDRTQQNRDALAKAPTGPSAEADEHAGHDHGDRGPSEDDVAQVEAVTLGQGSGTGNASRDGMVAELVRSLPPDVKQSLANFLAIYQLGEEGPTAPPRAVVGDPRASVRLDEWTDVRCPHCAQLHEDLETIRHRIPDGLVAIVPRHFPLDGTCNPQIGRKGDGVSCLAAKAQICVEGTPGAFEYAASLFQEGRGLTETRVYELGASLMPRERLEACVGAPGTQARLEEDIRLAMGYGIRGTPLVVVNRKQTLPDPVLILALVLSGADPAHPAFGNLPAPKVELGGL